MLLVGALLLMLMAPSSALAWKAAGHYVLAEQVAQGLPDGNVIKQAMLAQPAMTTWGSFGGDLGYGTAATVTDNWAPWADRWHYNKAGTFAAALLRNALADGDQAEIAYAAGWLTHVWGDMTCHGIYVNPESGGVFFDDLDTIDVHGSLEKFADPYVWAEVGGHDFTEYRAWPDGNFYTRYGVDPTDKVRALLEDTCDDFWGKHPDSASFVSFIYAQLKLGGQATTGIYLDHTTALAEINKWTRKSRLLLAFDTGLDESVSYLLQASRGDYTRFSDTWNYDRGAGDPRDFNAIVVEVQTGTTSGAGTDDTVWFYLQTGPNIQKRWPLNHGQGGLITGGDYYSDFENGDCDEYYLLIDEPGFDPRNVQWFYISKPDMYPFGDWQFARVRVWLNGLLVTDKSPNVWLTGGNNQWYATDWGWAAAPDVTDEGIDTAEPGRMEFRWDADKPPGAREYEYCVGTRPGYADVVPWTYTGKATSAVADDLEPNTTYYASVKARQPGGVWGVAGSTDGVTTLWQGVAAARQDPAPRYGPPPSGAPVLFVAGPAGLFAPNADWNQAFTTAAGGLVTFSLKCYPLSGTNCALSVDGTPLMTIKDVSEPPSGYAVRTASMFLNAGAHTLAAHNSGTGGVYVESINVGESKAPYTVVAPCANLGTLDPSTTLSKEFTTTADGLACLRYRITCSKNCRVYVYVDGKTMRVHDLRVDARPTELPVASEESVVFAYLKAGTHKISFWNGGTASATGSAVAWVNGLGVGLDASKQPVLFVAGPSGLFAVGADWNQTFATTLPGLVTFRVKCSPLAAGGAFCPLTVDGTPLMTVKDVSEPPGGHYIRTASMFLNAGTHTLNAHNSGTSGIYLESVNAGLAPGPVVASCANLGTLNPGTTLSKDFTTATAGLACLRYRITSSLNSWVSVYVDGKVMRVHCLLADANRTEVAAASKESLIYAYLDAGTHKVSFVNNGTASATGSAVAWVNGLGIGLDTSKKPVLFASGPTGQLPTNGDWQQTFTTGMDGLVDFRLKYTNSTVGSNCAYSVDGVSLLTVTDQPEPYGFSYARSASMFLKAGSHTFSAHNYGSPIWLPSVNAGVDAGYVVIVPSKTLGHLNAGVTQTQDFTTAKDGLVYVRYRITSESGAWTYVKVDGINVRVHSVDRGVLNTEQANASVERFVYLYLPAGAHTLAFSNAATAGKTGTGGVDIDGLGIGLVPVPGSLPKPVIGPPITFMAGAANIWQNKPVILTFTAVPDDTDTVARTEYRIDDGDWTTGTSCTVTASTAHTDDGTHRVEYRSVGTAGGTEETRWCEVNIDTVKPITVASSRARVVRNRTATLKYMVVDASPNGGTAVVTIKIKNRAGRIKKTLKLGTQDVNVTLSAKFKCRLAKGTYRYYVYAVDVAGNTQSKAGRNTLTVR